MNATEQLKQNRAENFALFHMIRTLKEQLQDPALQGETVQRAMYSYYVDLMLLYKTNEQKHSELMLNQ